jgi:conjugal transfer/entry exclusion protein
MFQHKNKKLTQIISQILVVIFLITPFFVVEKSLADSADENVNENAETEEEIFSSQQTVGEIENQIANNQKEWKDLQEQRNYYLNILKEKQEERMSLENQISILNAQISKAELDIKTTQSEIEKTILEIQKITLEIQKKEEEISHQKEN